MGFLSNLWIWLYLNTLGTLQAIKEQTWDRHRVPRNLPRGEGKNVVITGGNRGIGFEAVKDLLNLGYHVIIGCRNPNKCQQDLNEAFAKQVIQSKDFECLQVDLMSLESVRKFGNEIVAKGIPIHVLANNAGIMFGPRKETRDGFESQFGVNFLSHFLLTSILLPQLRAAGKKSDRKARILNVSSLAHWAGRFMDFDDLQFKKSYSAEAAYGNSKAAQVMFTKYLNSKLKAEGEPILVNCVHPGVVNTGLYEHVAWTKLVSFALMKTATQGGHAITHGCISSELKDDQGGLYIDNSRPVESAPFTNSIENQKKMWDIAMKLTGVKEFGT